MILLSIRATRPPAGFLLPAPRSLFLLLIAAGQAVLAGSAPAQQPPMGAVPPPPKAVDFRRDVEPILRKHCHSCHGPELQHGGLRLDERTFAAAGGHSHRPILGGASDQNELLRRVRSTDPALRMPRSAAPLPPEEIEILKAWVEDGSPWLVTLPEMQHSSDAAVRQPPWWERLIDRYEVIAIHVRPHTVPLLILALLIGLLERYRGHVGKRAAAAVREGRPPPSPWFPRLLKITPAHYLNFVLATALFLTGRSLWIVNAEFAASKANPASMRTGGGSSSESLSLAGTRTTIERTVSRYGTPPRPDRPHHPRQLAGTYYRGNCERSEKLYNGGNYLTAKFHIQLCDESGQPLTVGDPVPESGFYVQMDMERGAGTHESFYNKATIAAVALSTEHFTNVSKDPHEPLVRLDVVKPDWAWTARYPLGKPADERPDALETMVYVYRGTTVDAMKGSTGFSGDPHYGICAELKLKDGRLTAESDLWMGSLFIVPTLEFPDPKRVPLDEWFDFRPIPEIVGGNTTDDPKLLGIPDPQASKP